MKYIILCLLVIFLVISCSPVQDEFKIKTKRDHLHSKYLRATVKYLNNVVYLYPCDLKMPPMPKITVAKTKQISRYCPKGARACYAPFTNHVFYEEGDYEALKHEFAHAILHYSLADQQCTQELIIQQMDYILKDHFDGKRGRFPKSKKIKKGGSPHPESRL